MPTTFRVSWIPLLQTRRQLPWSRAGSLPLLRRLEKEFPEPILARAGLIEKHDTAGHLLTHGLYDCNAAVIGLKHKSNDVPFDLLTSDGTISGKLGMLATLRDNYSRRMLKSRPYLLATTSMQEVVLLRALGFAATLCSDLPGCRSFAQLQALSRYFSSENKACEIADPQIIMPFDNWIPATMSAQPASPAKPALPLKPGPVQRSALILIGWNLLLQTLEVPTGLPAVLRCFRELEDHLHLDFSDVNVWRPSKQFLARFTFAMRFPDPKPLRAIVMESMEMDTIYYDELNDTGSKLDPLLADHPGRETSSTQTCSEDNGEII